MMKRKLIIVVVIMVFIAISAVVLWFFSPYIKCWIAGGYVMRPTVYGSGEASTYEVCISRATFADAGKPCSSDKECKECESGTCASTFVTDYSSGPMICSSTKKLFIIER